MTDYSDLMGNYLEAQLSAWFTQIVYPLAKSIFAFFYLKYFIMLTCFLSELVSF